MLRDQDAPLSRRSDPVSIRRVHGPLVALVAAATAVCGCGGDATTSSTNGGAGTSVTVTLDGIDGSGVSGTGSLVAADGRIRGTVRLLGMDAGSVHAMHIHGVAGENHGCADAERTDEHLVDLPDVTADADGHAVVQVDVEDPGDAIRAGTYLMVHRDPTEDDHHASLDRTTDSGPRVIFAHSSTPNPGIACGEFR